MTTIKQVDDNIKNTAFEKSAQVKIYQLNLIAQVIDLAFKRGAFGGTEASQVGALYDTIVAGINRALELTEEELKKKESENITIVDQPPA
jgi:hypothetical protein